MIAADTTVIHIGHFKSNMSNLLYTKMSKIAARELTT